MAFNKLSESLMAALPCAKKELLLIGSGHQFVLDGWFLMVRHGCRQIG